MTKTKTTKRALFASVLSLLLCVSMLIGSTFAWFTDTATTGVNKIQAGTLKIDFMMKKADGTWENAEGKKLDFIKSAEAPAGEEILWEPGVTYALPAVKLVNNGNLALKFKMLVNGVAGSDMELAEVLEVIVNGENLGITLADIMADPDGVAYGTLLPEAETIAYTIALHMKKEAGNKYQGMTISGLSLTAYATQLTHEYDSFGNQYDADAEYAGAFVNGVHYSDIQEAISAAKPGATIALAGDITVDEQLVVDKNLTLDLSGYTITGTRAVGESVLRILAPDKDTEITVTINAENGGITTEGNSLPVYAGHVESGKTNVIINGGHFESGWKWAVYQNNGTCTINGGSFKANGVSGHANGQPVYNSSVLDNFDSSDELTGKYIINGGKFYGFNPACLNLNKGDHHDHDSIAEGKTGILDEDGWFVVADGSLAYHILCDCGAPSTEHQHCYASLEDAQAALAINNCPYDKIVEGVGTCTCN